MGQLPSDPDAGREWIRTNAAAARRALANPEIQAAVCALLVGSSEAERERRLIQIQRDLGEIELRWTRRES
jgi:hypothetical protein